MRAFAKAVAFGTLAGACLPIMLLLALSAAPIIDGNSEGDLLSWLALIALPIPLTLLFVLPASLFLGLPVTALLSKLNLESSATYVGLGIFVGFGIPTLILLAYGIDTWWLALCGALSGGVTARTWWVDARESHATSLDEF